MTKEQYEFLIKLPADSKIDTDLSTKDRTLIYGYTCDRQTFHVYIKNKKIHIVQYDYHGNSIIEFPVFSAIGCIPNKRIYPEACDYGFCCFLHNEGVTLPFTTYNEERPQQTFYGRILE